ncbi:MAG: hypothetical protein H0U57_14655 [Tatlockia sp.]|nr:hypothetical protein [Tatlockia sp.]
MALTEEEKNSKWAEKDSNFKKRFQDEVLQAKREKDRNYERTVGAEKAEAKKTKNAKSPATGKLYWDIVKENAERSMAAAGYQEWANLMNEFALSTCGALNRALRNDPIELTNLIPYSDEIGGIWLEVKDTIHDKMLAPYLLNPIKRPFLDDKELPSVGFTVALNNQNQLEVEITKDGKPVNNPEFTKHIQEGFTAWAATKNYELDTGTQTYKKESGKVLNQESLLRKNTDHPEESFLAFATGRFEMPLTGGMRP